MTTPVSSFKLPRSIFNAQLKKSILSLWFGDLPRSATLPNDADNARWFGFGNDSHAFDSQCRSCTLHALEEIGPKKLALPPFTTHSADRRQALDISAPFRDLLKDDEHRAEREETGLSLVLLLDQMPRNIFRNEQGLIYTHYDRLSRALVHSMMGIAGKDGEQDDAIKDLHTGSNNDWRYSSAYKQWLLMPLMHSEDIRDHDIFEQEVAKWKEHHANDQAVTDALNYVSDFETKHRRIIEKFNRYPYRNEWMGRQNTSEEIEFLKEGESFGSGKKS